MRCGQAIFAGVDTGIEFEWQCVRGRVRVRASDAEWNTLFLAVIPFNGNRRQLRGERLPPVGRRAIGAGVACEVRIILDLGRDPHRAGT